ncbi:MAG: aryl-sulfate sulfotransferase [Bacteroidota bacterium]|jgi:hypothetical protein
MIMKTSLPKNSIKFSTILQHVVTLVLVAWSMVLSQNNAPNMIQYISPLPSSSNNSQQTNIILRLENPFPRGTVFDSSAVDVEGSASGHHSGKLMLSDDDRIVLFNPQTPFSPYERVTVAVAPSIYDRSGKSIGVWKFYFETSHLSARAQESVLQKIPQCDIEGNQSTAPNGSSFSPGLLAKSNGTVPDDLPRPDILVSNNPSDGAIFFSTWKIKIGFNSLVLIPFLQEYLMIVDNAGNPIYYKQVGQTTDFKPLSNGNLSYFDYTTTQFYEMNQNYMIIDSFACGNGYQTDPHDLRLLKNGHRILIGLDPQTVNMRAIVQGGDTSATVIGIVVQELDQQKNVVFQWRSFDHFLITDATHEDLTAATIDYVHPNALDIDYDGNILLSSRHMDDITKIDHNTGAIIWRWGGKNNQFTFVNDSIGFSHQHDIDLTSSGTYTIFDNGNFHVPPFSRALEYSLDQQNKIATLIWQFRHTPDTYTFATGSVQRLPNGNTFIGWGANYLSATEVRPDGSTAYEIQYGDSLMSYRAFRFAWPLASTAVAASPATPSQFVLEQNYPNPFNPSTTIKYVIPQQSYVTIKIFDMLGREVTTLVNQKKETGSYFVEWNASRMTSGVYFYTLQAGGFKQTRKLLLIK